MRISCVKGDAGYTIYRDVTLNNQVPHVFLDDKPVTEVLTADTVEGFVLRYRTDFYGRIVGNSSTGEAETEVLYGVVTVGLKPR